MEAVTGLPYAAEDVMQAGERINNVARAFNVREGFGAQKIRCLKG